MGYTREERLDIGKQIYNNEISKSDAAIKYSISEGTARDYMRLYRDVNRRRYHYRGRGRAFYLCRIYLFGKPFPSILFGF